MARGRSTTRADEDDQRTSMSDSDVPSASLGPPPPVSTPDKPVQRHDEPPGVELEGERSSQSSSIVGLTADEADVLVMSEGDEDPRNRPKAAQDASERISKRLDQSKEDDPPMTAQVEPYDPGDSADTSPASGSVQDVGNMPTKLHQVSKRVSKHSERKGRRDSPGRPRT